METQLLDDFLKFDFKSYTFPILAVYQHPLDFPEQFVVRLFDLNQPTMHAVVKNHLIDIRVSIPSSFHRINRHAMDVLSLVETWI